MIKSPLNYTGNKYKLLPVILPLFPKDINIFIDLFAGGCNVGINIEAKEIYFNDNCFQLIDLYECFLSQGIDSIFDYINYRINTYNPSSKDGYNKLREEYNINKNPLDLFVLTSYSFHNQIRFNKKNNFNSAFGGKSGFNPIVQSNLIRFLERLKSIKSNFSRFDFIDFNLSNLSSKDFVYIDPPYLIANSNYNKNYTEREEILLLNIIDNINNMGVKFGLSNLLFHKGKSNFILKDWLENNKQYKITEVNFNNSFNNIHNIPSKEKSIEVYITNFF